MESFKLILFSIILIFDYFAFFQAESTQTRAPSVGPPGSATPDSNSRLSAEESVPHRPPSQSVVTPPCILQPVSQSQHQPMPTAAPQQQSLSVTIPQQPMSITTPPQQPSSMFVFSFFYFGFLAKELFHL